MKFSKNTQKLKGDASSRIFYRKKIKKKSSIIVYSKKNKKINLLNYDSVNKILLKNKIFAPMLLSKNYSKNFIEIEDFGNQTILKLFKKKKINKIKIYKEIIVLLNKLQSIRQKRIKNFNNKIYTIPIYTSKILQKEANLFSEWYIEKKLNKSEQKEFKKSFNKIVKKLIKKIQQKNDTFVHRDFHISNLMMVKNKIGIIDSQDALLGNKAYDLASLIDDVRFKTNKKLKNEIFDFYLKTQKLINKKSFKNDFNIISVLRNLKIIGIFTRLAVRDNKKSYLKLIPYAWSLIKLRSENHYNFKDLNNLLKVLNYNK
ncbi:phosphotransferase [Candidatus Pelagibacter sp.]|nr:phosphotransferase [Candidatus Pelagibacter sp.]